MSDLKNDDIPDIESDDAVISWLTNLDTTESTRVAYIKGMRDYVSCHKMTPTQLLDEAMDEYDSGVQPLRQKINTRLNVFKRWLLDGCRTPTEVKQGKPARQLAENTMALRLVGAKSFYRTVGLTVPNIKISRNVTTKKENRAIPTKEDIRDVLKLCDPLEKAIILVGVSSGLAATEIINLRIKDFRDGYDPESDIVCFELKRQKTDIEFTTFISPEATRAVFDYLQFRNRTRAKNGSGRDDKRKYLEKQHIYSEDGYLFINRHVPESYHETHDEEIRRLTDNAFFKIYAGLSEKARKCTPDGHYNIIRSHNMRKYFNSTLINEGVVDPFYVDFFMGHRPLQNMPHYLVVQQDKFRDIYKKCVPYITVEKALDVRETKEWQDAMARVKALEHENSNYAMRAAEVEDMSKINEEMAVIMRKTLDRANKTIKIFEDGSKALGLENPFDDMEFDFTRKKKEETKE